MLFSGIAKTLVASPDSATCFVTRVNHAKHLLCGFKYPIELREFEIE